jgi:hypothetical protein
MRSDVSPLRDGPRADLRAQIAAGFASLVIRVATDVAARGIDVQELRRAQRDIKRSAWIRRRWPVASVLAFEGLVESRIVGSVLSLADALDPYELFGPHRARMRVVGMRLTAQWSEAVE